MVDNVDSFTFMLVDYLVQAGGEVAVVRSDAVTVDELLATGPHGVVISPGPGRPEQGGISVALAAACIAAKRPLLGICLGHQAIALACGASVDRTYPMHGKISQVRHDGSGLFGGLPSPIAATRYHSLAVTDPRLPLIANAWSEEDVVMGMRHAEAPVHGIQFHPESIASQSGLALLEAFVDLTRDCA